jgi:hypothetical protein
MPDGTPNLTAPVVARLSPAVAPQAERVAPAEGEAKKVPVNSMKRATA